MAPTSRHADGERQIGFFAPTELRDATKALLHARELDMTRFLLACLLTLQAHPDHMISALTHWPEPKPWGRPPRER